MSVFTPATQKIVNAHKADFNCTNVASKLKSYGGYTAYLKKLGGVFAEYAGKTANVKTVLQFQHAAEYVFGLMSIYGFDYDNDKVYYRWGGGSPFYINGKKGKCNWGRIDDLCSVSSKYKTTNCNYGADTLLYKLGMMGGSGQPNLSASYKKQVNTYHCKVIRNKTDLHVGDLVHMFHSKITSNDPAKWSGWGHVAVVGEITKDQIILYDTGSRYIKSGNFKHAISRSGSTMDESYKNYAGWVGIHWFDLVDDSVSDADLAIEVIHGDFGSGDARKKALGGRYDAVQKLVNEYLSEAGHAAYIRACANYVLEGKAGKGEARKKFFGSLYDEVQKKVDWTINTADAVIAGKFGSGEARKKALGDDYDLVQAEVNRMLE